MKKIDFGWAGDSTQVGRVWRPGNPPDVLEVSPWNECATATMLLKEKFGDENVSSVNWSRGGTNAIQWCNGDPSIGMPSMASIMASPESAGIDVVIFQIGINDAYNGSITQTAFRWCIQKICNDVRAAGKKIVLQTPCPIDRADMSARMWDMQNSIKAVAAAMTPPVQVIDHYAATIAGAVGWTALLSDGTYPSDELYRWKGHTTFCGLIPHFL